jgi:hypothetical protein
MLRDGLISPRSKAVAKAPPPLPASTTNPNGRTVSAGFENKVPRTVDDFVAYYHDSYIYPLNKEDMEPYRRGFVKPKERTSAFIASAEAERRLQLTGRAHM